jgi:hypothetical protein
VLKRSFTSHPHLGWTGIKKLISLFFQCLIQPKMFRKVEEKDPPLFLEALLLQETFYWLLKMFDDQDLY